MKTDRKIMQSVRIVIESAMRMRKRNKLNQFRRKYGIVRYRKVHETSAEITQFNCHSSTHCLTLKRNSYFQKRNQ